MEIYAIIITILFIFAVIIIARTNKKLKEETLEANRLRTEMLRAQNNVILCKQELETLKADIKEMQKTIEELKTTDKE